MQKKNVKEKHGSFLTRAWRLRLARQLDSGILRGRNVFRETKVLVRKTFRNIIQMITKRSESKLPRREKKITIEMLILSVKG